MSVLVNKVRASSQMPQGAWGALSYHQTEQHHSSHYIQLPLRLRPSLLFNPRDTCITSKKCMYIAELYNWVEFFPRKMNEYTLPYFSRAVNITKCFYDEVSAQQQKVEKREAAAKWVQDYSTYSRWVSFTITCTGGVTWNNLLRTAGDVCFASKKTSN